jgi:hypothetical protein
MDLLRIVEIFYIPNYFQGWYSGINSRVNLKWHFQHYIVLMIH